MKTGIELIAAERQEQIEKHGYTESFQSANPQWYNRGELAQAAQYCITPIPFNYPDSWSDYFMDKIHDKQDRLSEKEFRIETLKIAGALIAAEIDRLQAIEQ